MVAVSLESLKRTFAYQEYIYEVKPIEEYLSEEYAEVVRLLGYEPVGYQDTMKKNATSGTSFRVYRDGVKVGFVYTELYEGYKYVCTTFVMHDMIGLQVALRVLFEVVPTDFIVYYPHSKEDIFLKSAISGEMLRKYHMTGNSVVIMKEPNYSKGTKMFKYLGVEEL